MTDNLLSNKVKPMISHNGHLNIFDKRSKNDPLLLF